MRTITYLQALREAIDEELARDEKVFLLGEDIGPHGNVFGVTRGLFDKYGPKRIRQTPISEAAIVGAACGAAMIGCRPIAEIMYIDFITIGMDQLVNQVAKMRYISRGQFKVPLVIRTQGGAGRGKGPHHSQSLESWFLHVPGLEVVQPATPYDVKGMLKSAVRDDCPVLFIENAILYPTKGEVPEEEYTVPLGKAEIKRQGSDITIVANSYMVLKSLEAAEELDKTGISAEVIDIRSLCPMDINTIIDSVKKTNRAVVVHEDTKTGGVGAEIAAQIQEKAFDYLEGPIQRICGLGLPIPYSQTLENEVLPNTARIVDGVKQILNVSHDL